MCICMWMWLLQERFSGSPSCQSFSSSTVISYSSDSGAPKVYQQTRAIRTAPGGVRHTLTHVKMTLWGYTPASCGHRHTLWELLDYTHILVFKTLWGPKTVLQELYYPMFLHTYTHLPQHPWAIRTSHGGCRHVHMRAHTHTLVIMTLWRHIPALWDLH